MEFGFDCLIKLGETAAAHTHTVCGAQNLIFFLINSGTLTETSTVFFFAGSHGYCMSPLSDAGYLFSNQQKPLIFQFLSASSCTKYSSDEPKQLSHNEWPKHCLFTCGIIRLKASPQISVTFESTWHRSEREQEHFWMQYGL